MQEGGIGRPPGVAVVGCGHWGRNLVRVLFELGALRAVVDPSREARVLARRCAPGVRVHARLEPLWRDPEIRAVAIATPAETHFELARAALDAGLDAFVEKPLATEVEAAEVLAGRAAELGRILMVGHLLEYHPALLALRALVRRGELGKLAYIVSNRLNLGKIRTEENALWSFAPHDIAAILRLVGAMPSQVSATGGSYIQPNVADVTVTQLLFDSGVRGHVFVSWLHPFKEQRLILIGSDRMASYDDVDKSLVLYDRRVDWRRGQPVPVRGEGVLVPFDGAEPLVEECRHFLHCVATRSTPRTDGQEGVRVLRVLEAAQRSLVTNGQPVSLALEGFGRPSPARARAASPGGAGSGRTRAAARRTVSGWDELLAGPPRPR